MKTIHQLVQEHIAYSTALVYVSVGMSNVRETTSIANPNQCPICYAPKSEDEGARYLHTERSRSNHSRARLWTNCESKE